MYSLGFTSPIYSESGVGHRRRDSDDLTRIQTTHKATKRDRGAGNGLRLGQGEVNGEPAGHPLRLASLRLERVGRFLSHRETAENSDVSDD